MNFLSVSALLKSEKPRGKIQFCHMIMLYWTQHYCPYIFNLILPQLWDFFFSCPERRKLEEKHFHSVIQRHHVNASILFLTTSINCRSYSPTRSMFLLEREAELLRLKWDEECSKRCCSCPLITPSPPVILSWDANLNILAFTETYTGTQTLQVRRPKHLINTDPVCRSDTNYLLAMG